MGHQHAEDAQGKDMLEGEFHSMCELYKTAPRFILKPYTWGKLNVSNPDTYYFLCGFIEMTDQAPDSVHLCTKLKELHQLSATSLKKQRGIQAGWNYYIQLGRGAMRLNTEFNGNWKNLEQCVDRLISHVVPQVLGPLESDGRMVKPRLIHGDLWVGNTGTERETGNIYVFDASVHYAHNEMGVAIWRGKFDTVFQKEVYLKTSLSMVDKSEPREQFEDGNKIHSIYHALHESACSGGFKLSTR
ncbi:MAG: hypothetical protein LQ352_007752, partial [Teloschistes flavicans]